MAGGRRITIVASEILGRPGTGGAGTADSLLAIALGRHGHHVELLVARGRTTRDLDAEWGHAYAGAGVTVRDVEHVRARPTYLAPGLEVFQALRARPPEVTIVDDWRGLGHTAQRARQVGLALGETAFVVHCHGTARVLAEFAQKVPDTLARFGEEVAERGSLALADAVVSPSEWLLGWMRRHGWPALRSASLIPYVREYVALGRERPPPTGQAAIRRLAFFGQLREGKGLRIYLQALNELDPSLLRGRELLFLGRETPRWNAAAIRGALRGSVEQALAAVRVEPSLSRAQALAELRSPGTLAVMPSLLDNSPNTVSECIEHGVPFVATRTGGIPELVAEDDRPRVLCETTPEALAATLRLALEAPTGFAAARPASDPAASLQAWLELVETVAPPARGRAGAAVAVDVVVTDETSAERAQALAARPALGDSHVVRAGSRRAGVDASGAEWILFLDEEDVPDEDLLDRLVAAQQAAAADAVTCAVRVGDDAQSVRLFLGDPGALGLVENAYGVVVLVRRSRIAQQWDLDGAVDPDWVLLAHLSFTGARIVSIPEPLATHRGKPGAVQDVPGDGLAVLEAFEAGGGESVRDLPQLAATLGAALARAQEPGTPGPQRSARRGLRVLREEGPGGVVRRLQRLIGPDA